MTKRMGLKQLLMVLLLLGSITAIAQVGKGTIFTGGNLNLRNYSNKESSSASMSESSGFNIGVNPRAGYFLSKSFALGVNVRVDFQNSDSYGAYLGVKNYKHHQAAYTLGAGIFARYYSFRGNKFAFFLEGATVYAYGMLKSKDGKC